MITSTIYTYDPLTDPWTLANEVGANSSVNYVGGVLTSSVDLTAGEAGTVAKASVRREDVPGYVGNIVTMEGDFILATDAASFHNMTILDLEDQTILNDPGVRLIIRTGNFLCMEGKLSAGGDYRQALLAITPEVEFHVKWEVYLHPTNGIMRLWQDDTLILTANGPTMEGSRANKVETGITAWLAQEAAAMELRLFTTTVTTEVSSVHEARRRMQVEAGRARGMPSPAMARPADKLARGAVARAIGRIRGR